MAGKKRRGRLISLTLFILINLIVFNKSAIYGTVKNVIGFGSLQLSEVKTVTLDFNEERNVSAKTFVLDEYIISASENKITLFSNEGEAKWQLTTDFDDLKIDGNMNFFAAADYSKGNIDVYDYRGNINANVNGLGEISDIKITEEGYLLIFLSGSNSIAVYDPQLNLLSQIAVTMGDVIEYGFNNYNNMIYIATLEMSGKQLNSYLYKYDLMGHLNGSFQLLDEIIFDFYFENDSIVKVSDKEIGIYSESMGLNNSINAIGNVDLVAYKDHYLVAQIFDENSQIIETENDFDAVAFDLSKNELIFKKSFKEDYQGMVFKEDYLLCYNNNVIDVYNYSGDQVSHFDLVRDIKSMGVLDNGKIVVYGVDYFTIYELKF
ncbi:MAG: hypothetical protein JW702_09650 [Clostridiales bacterium]|nr:hypothetical protein [Clostridiales bacterium]